jgi:hypothetical protein
VSTIALVRCRRAPAASILSLALAAAVTLVTAVPPMAAEDLHLAGTAGEQLNDAELAKGANIVVVWATWSPRSHDIVERVQALAHRWSSRARVLTLDFEEDRPTVAAFLAGRSLGAPIFLDGDGNLCKKYAVATLPGLLVFVDGKVEYHGKLPDDPDRLLTSLLH